MKRLIHKFVLLVLIALAGTLYAQEADQVISQVHKAINEANSGSLSSFFHTTVDLKIGDTDGNFSKSQTEMIVKDFFSRNPVKSFTVKHQGSSDDGSRYSIGTYVTKTDVEYRVYVLLKKSGADLRIIQLQFEED